MHTKIISGMLLLLLAACAPEARSPYVVSDDLTHRYMGQPANEFFKEYGLPAADFALNDDSTVYHWASARSGLTSAIATTSAYVGPDGVYEIANVYDGHPKAQYCELRIYTDAANVIQHIDVAVDTMGKVNGSRCSEIFEEFF